MLSFEQAAQPNPSYPALCRQDTTSPWSTFETFFRGTGAFHDGWRRRSETSAGERVISTNFFHKLKDEGIERSRIGARQFGAGTPRFPC